MSGRYLLDTNIVIALFAGETAIAKRLRDADEVFVPSIALGEMYYGALKSTRSAENLARIEELVSDVAVLICDRETAKSYGQVKDGLRQKGKPIPENDIWIAAIAFQHDLTLVTRDNHFGEIEHLRVELW